MDLDRDESSAPAPPRWPSDGLTAPRRDLRFALTSAPVSWDDAMGELGSFLVAPRVRFVIFTAVCATNMAWSRLERIDAFAGSVELRLGGNAIRVDRHRGDRIVCERWDHDLCRALIFTRQEHVLSVQASWWREG